MAGFHNWRDLKDAMRDRGFIPNKSLGQNFLISPKVLDSIVKAADVKENDNVLEIGVGAGTLTGHLLAIGAKVTGIEIDARLYGVTKEQFRNIDSFDLHLMSALGKGKRLNPILLEMIEEMQENGGYKLVANLPYNISTPIVVELMRAKYRPKSVSILVQKEFAQRFVSPPGGRQFSPISVFAATFGTSRIMRSVPSRLFWPVPAVESAVVRWQPKEDAPEIEYEAEFFKVVSAMFLMRRKIISNVVKSLAKIEPTLFGEDPVLLLEKAGINPESRAEQIEVSKFYDYFKLLNVGGE